MWGYVSRRIVDDFKHKLSEYFSYVFRTLLASCVIDVGLAVGVIIML